jgi:tetraacyldisaccharide 4'-kinase
MILLKALLFPLAVLYDLITSVRNHLFDIGHKRSFQFEIPVISIGNLNVGGSGKTPMVEYVVRLLMHRKKIAILSRGYGRRTRGLRMASETDTASTLGDEPLQLYRKFQIPVTVCEDRALAIPHILHQFPSTDAIILDDAFQHRTVDPSFSILVSDFHKPFYEDFVLPMGRLREARRGAGRSQAVVITKCPELLSGEIQATMIRRIHRYAPGVPVFFSRVSYLEPVPFGAANEIAQQVILVTGIGNAEPLRQVVAKRFNMLHHFKFRDHHSFTSATLKKIVDYRRDIQGPTSILTTEKDMVRLLEPALSAQIGNEPWFYLPIHVSFIKNGSDFDSMVLQSAGKREIS